MKISLDVQAIKMLIDNDPDCIIEIKKGIVDNLIKKGFIPLLSLREVKDEIMLAKKAQKAARDNLDEFLKTEIKNQIGSVKISNDWARVPIVTLNKDMEAKFRNLAFECVSDRMEEIINKRADEVLADRLKYIEAVVERRLTKNLNALVDAEVKRRLDAAKNA